MQPLTRQYDALSRHIYHIFCDAGSEFLKICLVKPGQWLTVTFMPFVDLCIDGWIRQLQVREAPISVQLINI